MCKHVPRFQKGPQALWFAYVNRSFCWLVYRSVCRTQGHNGLWLPVSEYSCKCSRDLLSKPDHSLHLVNHMINPWKSID